MGDETGELRDTWQGLHSIRLRTVLVIATKNDRFATVDRWRVRVWSDLTRQAPDDSAAMR